MKKLLFILLIGIIALSGCGGSNSPKVAGQQGSLTLSFIESGVKTQTIQPDLDMSIATYDIAGSGPNGTSFHKNNVQAGTSVTIPALAVGPWTLSVDANNSEETNIAAGFSQVYVTAGGPTTAEVTVQPLEGNGALSLQVSWPSGLLTIPIVVGTLIPHKGGAAVDIPFNVYGEAATYVCPSLAAGYYTLHVKLQDDGVDQWGAVDVVRIIAGQTTNGGFPLNARPGQTGRIELVVVPDLQNPITIGFSGQQETLPMGTDMTVTATPSESVDTFQWYLNGELLPGETRESITIGSTLGEGNYRLDVMVIKENIAGSGNVEFTTTSIIGSHVYIAGRNGDTACYWIDTTRTDLPGGRGSANSVYVSGSTVYLAGYRYDEYDNGVNNTACFWTGTTRTNLPSDGLQGNANSIYVSGGTVYTAGQYYDNISQKHIPCYWTGTTRTDLPSEGSITSYTTSIFVSNGTVYTSGSYLDESSGKFIACYWTGTTRINLPSNSSDFSWATSIYVAGGKVYTAGYYMDGDKYIPCYWTDLTKTDLHSDEGGANSIFVTEGMVYTAGYYTDGSTSIPCYWTNTTRTDLPSGDFGSVNSIYVSNGTVYTAGYYNEESAIACYWTGTTRTDLPGFGGPAYANSIIVK